MTNSKIIEWQNNIADCETIISLASKVVSKLSKLSPTIIEASNAFEDIVISGGKPYDKGELKKNNDNILKAKSNFESLIRECNLQITKLQSEIAAEKKRLADAEKARKAVAARRNNEKKSSSSSTKNSSSTSTKKSSSSSTSVTQNRYSGTRLPY